MEAVLMILLLSTLHVFQCHDVIAAYIREDIEDSGQCVGYRSMWQRLVNDHRLRVPRDKVLSFLRHIVPDGIDLRKRHRLKRRKYRVKCPNYVWHVDGYDKLKPYGLCVHDAIDGYSRRIIWLEVSQSNNVPAIIAMYYLGALTTLAIVPRILRCGKGTENAILALLQPFFRYNHTDSMSGVKSFIYGWSVSNQRLEAWWGTLRRQGMQWWISVFKDLKYSNEYDELNPVHVECLKLCFTRQVQDEFDRIDMSWNRNAEIPSGKADLMYFIPEVFGCLNFGKRVDLEDANACCEIYGSRRKICCQEMEDLGLLIPDLRVPVNVHDALQLYRKLLVLIEENLE